jgi:hypothetical protein
MKEELNQGIPETVARNTPVTLADRRREILGKVNTKIARAKGLWQTVRTFSAPLPGDSAEAIAQENRQLETHVEHASQLLPHAVEGAKTSAQLYDTLFTTLNENDGRRRLDRYRLHPYVYATFDDRLELFEEYFALQSKDDIRFLTAFTRGIQKAQDRRTAIRETLAGLGDNLTDPSSFNDLLPGEFSLFRDHIREVVLSPFTIGLVIDSNAYMKHRLSERKIKGRIDHSVAFNDPHNLFCFIDEIGKRSASSSGEIERIPSAEDRLMELLFGKEKKKAQPNNIKSGFQEIVDHEDFHSFFTGFRLAPNLHYIAFGGGIRDKVDEYKLCEDPERRKELARSINGLLDNIVNVNWEEFLADIASLEGRKNVTSGHLEISLTGQLKYLRSFLGKHLEVDAMVRHHISILSGVVPTTNGLYLQVKEQIPERAEDLDMAFAIFPPSQIRHVKQLVDMWISSISRSK